MAIGRDGRLSGPELGEALCAGVLASGCDILNVGIVPTPLLYYATHISNRLIMALLYLGLIGVLLVGYWDASMHLSYLWETSDDS